MTYIVNGKEIEKVDIGDMHWTSALIEIKNKVNQLLEALSDKEEKCKWCKAGIPENCIDQTDLKKQ